MQMNVIFEYAPNTDESHIQHPIKHDIQYPSNRYTTVRTHKYVKQMKCKSHYKIPPYVQRKSISIQKDIVLKHHQPISHSNLVQKILGKLTRLANKEEDLHLRKKLT